MVKEKTLSSIALMLVSSAAGSRIVTQRSSSQALHDDPKNGCEGDYPNV